MAAVTTEDLGHSSALEQAVAAFAVATLFTNVSQYWHAESAGPRTLYFILVVIAGGAASLVLAPHRRSEALRSPLLVWVAVYLAISTGWALWRPLLSTQTDQALIDRYRSMAFLLAMVLVFEDRRARTLGRAGVVLVAVAASFVNLGETIGLISFADRVHRTMGRAAGLYVNPNQAGLTITFGLAAGVTVLPRAWRIPVLMVCACGVAATFSRGAMGCLAALVVVLLLRREIPVGHTALATLAVVLGVTLTGGRLQGLLESGGSLNNDTLARMQMRADDSGRFALAKRVWKMFLESPWSGHGLATERAGRVSHNMYLSLASEHGILGLLLIPALIWAFTFRRPAALGLGVVFAVSGVMSHNMLEAEYVLMSVALVASGDLDANVTASRLPESAFEPSC